MQAVIGSERLLRHIAAAGLAGLVMVSGCQSGSSNAQTEEDAALLNDPVNLRAGIPPSAQQVAQGTGSLEFEASSMGQLYLYDLDANRLIGTFFLRPGQSFVVGSSGRATIDGNEVRVDARLFPARSYIGYFVAGAGPAAQQDGQQTYQIIPNPPAGGQP